MADSSIEWLQGPDGKAGKTWNPLAGCSYQSPGCLNCYAMGMAVRLPTMGLHKYDGTAVRKPGSKRPQWTGQINLGTIADMDLPLTWAKPKMVFVNSMSDLFHANVPTAFIDQVFVTMWAAQWHTFQVLTKRIERAALYLDDRDLPERLAIEALAMMRRRDPEKARIMSVDDFIADLTGPLPNVLIGPSIEDQERANERLPFADRIGKLGWRVMISAEPLLGDVNFGLLRRPTDDDYRGWGEDGPIDFVITKRAQNIAWLIVGGESGNLARPCHLEWIAAIVKQCERAGVPVFVKQTGKLVLISNDQASEWPNDGGDLIYPRNWRPRYQGEDVEVRLQDKKGGTMSQWPERIRVRQAPRPFEQGA